MIVNIKAIDNIRHNGTLYRDGDIIENINIKEAERLVDLKVALFTGEISSEYKEPDLRVQLDENFNATELKEAAQEVGLEFPGNIKKADLIDLIIKSEKAEEVLNVEFEEYEEDEE